MNAIEFAFASILKKLRGRPWVEFCKAMQSLPSRDVNALLESMKLRVETSKDENEIGQLVASCHLVLAAYDSKPIVSYSIDPALHRALHDSEPIDPSMLVGDAFALPYPIMAIYLNGHEGMWYAFKRVGDALTILNRDNAFTVRCDHKVGDVFSDEPSTRAKIKILAYLTNNQDVITKKKKVEIPNGNPSKMRKKKGKTLEIIEGEIGGIFAKNIKLFNEQQNSHGNSNDEIDPVTGRKMKPHMRAGHWHTYRHGPGRTLTKLVFVHACAVNASEIARGTTLMIDVE